MTALFDEEGPISYPNFQLISLLQIMTNTCQEHILIIFSSFRDSLIKVLSSGNDAHAERINVKKKRQMSAKDPFLISLSLQTRFVPVCFSCDRTRTDLFNYESFFSFSLFRK